MKSRTSTCTASITLFAAAIILFARLAIPEQLAGDPLPAFGGFVAQDRSFTALIPFDWQVQVANQQHFLLTSPENEKVWVDVWDVPTDAQSLTLMSQTNPLANAMQIYSPPVAAIEVLTQLYPVFARGRVQKLTVVKSNPLPAPPVAKEEGVFDYRYLFQGQVPYEGEMLIMTLPPRHLPYV